MPTPRMTPRVAVQSAAVWYNLYLPSAHCTPDLLSHDGRTSCSPMMSARYLRQNSASSSSCLVTLEHVSGLACTRVNVCCCVRPAPHMVGSFLLVAFWEGCLLFRASHACAKLDSCAEVFLGACFEKDVEAPVPRRPPREESSYCRSLHAHSSAVSPWTPISGLSQNGLSALG